MFVEGNETTHELVSSFSAQTYILDFAKYFGQKQEYRLLLETFIKKRNCCDDFTGTKWFPGRVRVIPLLFNRSDAKGNTKWRF